MRRTERLTIPGVRSETLGERDNGKVFILTEMSAYAGQDWALRALLALSRSGAQLPVGALGAGWGALASFAFGALLGASHVDLKPLLDELLATVKYEHKPKLPLADVIPDSAGNGPVEEIVTFLTLYKAAWTLHTGFTLPASSLTTE